MLDKNIIGKFVKRSRYGAVAQILHERFAKAMSFSYGKVGKVGLRVVW